MPAIRTTASKTQTKPRSWPPETQPLVEMARRLTPADLPEPPWVLHWTAPTRIGQVNVPGGPCVKVTGNEVWLRGIQRDVDRGPGGARAKYGAIQYDLKALARVLAKRA